MTKQITAACREQPKPSRVAEVLGFFLPILAVIVACSISFFEMVIPIEKPAILVLASFLILVPFKSERLNVLQKIMGFYIVSVPVNELSSQYFQISFLPVEISVSFSTVVLSLCAIGYFIERVNLINALRSNGKANILCGWMLATGLIITHMIFLSLILNRFYGYGYERNLSVLGTLCLYFLLFIFLWGKLNNLRFRQCIGLILAVFYLAVIGVKG